MKQIPFQVSSRTARLIGRENVSNAEGAVVELVKNGHDADAGNVVIIFDGSDDLYIIDNGYGMTEEVIQNAWMTIGTDNKEVDPYTPGKRIKAGAKGIGRFAMDRLGANVEMHTLPKDQSDGYRWVVQWEDFEKKSQTIGSIMATLEDVPKLDLDDVIPAAYKATYSGIFSKQGTVLHISKLRDEWNEKAIDDLYQSLETLVPSLTDDSFSIEVKATKYAQKFGKVHPVVEDDYDYRLVAEYDSATQKVKATIYRNELDVHALETRYADVFKNTLMSSFPYNLNTFKVGSYTKEVGISELLPGFDDSSPLLKRLGDFSLSVIFAKRQLGDTEGRFPYKTVEYARRNQWLARFGGIKIFRDHFRVRPYGEAGDDWLRLGERKAQSPGGVGQLPTGWRVAPNQISGSVRISRLLNVDLEDKSSREGIKDNPTFELFKNIIKEMLGLLENDRNRVNFCLSELYKVNNKRAEAKAKGKSVADRIRKGAANGGKGTPPATDDEVKALATSHGALEEEVEEKNEEIKLLRNLASAGLITAAAAHELRALENILSMRAKDLRDLISPFITPDKVKDLVEEQNPFILLDDMAKTDQSIREWLNYALMPLRRDRRTRTLIEVSDYFSRLKEDWSTLLSERKIELQVDGASKGDKLRLFPIDLDTIFNNLIINSVESFARQRKRVSRKISISCQKQGNLYRIEYEDNGAGLDDSFKSDPTEIFLPQKTTKRDSTGKAIGTGMGMYLVKSVVDENKGEVSITKVDDGFGVRVILPIGGKNE